MAAGDVLQIDPTGTFQQLAPVGAGSLSNSGVTAGTYGDASNVARVTVNAQGQVTAAANVAITGGGAGTGLVPIFDSTLALAAATLDTGAGGIPSGHQSLYVLMYVRTASAVTNENVYLRFNADSGAHYDWALILNSAGSIAAFNAAAAAQIVLANTPGANATASYFGSFRLSIPAYDQTTGFKSVEAVGGTPAPTGFSFGQVTGGWRSTAAITRLSIQAQTGGNFVAGSRLTVYGTG